MVTGSHGTRMQWNYTGDNPGLAKSVSAASPRWLRLARSGDVIPAMTPPTARAGPRSAAVTLPGLASTVQAGMLATSPGYTKQTSEQVTSASGTAAPTDATATFNRVGLNGNWPGNSWAGTSETVRGISAYVTGHEAGYHQAGGTFTVTRSGDIAPDVTDGTPIDSLLAGLFLALIAVLVVGAQFMTAEYRRGLIRATLTASPRRGQMLAAKAIVLGGVSFAATLIAAAAALLAGIPLLRGSGNFVYPATALTEVRVIAGTAALVAVFAVFAVAVGAIVRHGAGSVAAVIAAIVLPYLLTAGIAVLPAGAADWVLRVTPAAGFAIRQAIPAYPQVAASYTPSSDYFPLAPWAGFAVTCAWAVLALALATYLLNRRDA